MNVTKLNRSVLNVSRLNASLLNASGIGAMGCKGKATMEDKIMDSMVLWYDLAKQGATNESMAADPRLIDHSGNGHHATCYNFAWTEDSGISTVNYPHALVSDGVDDYVMSLWSGFPIKSFILKNNYIKGDAEKGWGYIVSYHNEEGRRFYLAGLNDSEPTSSGIVTDIGDDTFYYRLREDLDESSTNELYLFSEKGGGQLSKNAFYVFIAFDRDLTTEEIEWVKTNLITE